jgi:two-component system, NtrC family, sensor kinase
MLKLNSIKNKVQFSSSILIAIILIISIMNYFYLRTIDKKIAFSFIISELFDAALEMRRFEKNYIIYKDKNDYLENLEYIERAEMILRENKDAIKKLSPDINILQMEKLLHDYKTSMKIYHERAKKDSVDGYIVEGKIRNYGKNLVDITENLSNAEKMYIQKLIVNAGNIRIASVGFLIIIGIFMSRYLSQMVVRPLQQLEDGMKKISEGNFTTLSVRSSDQEIISLSNAFSRMMQEIELRQKRFMMQSEKLITLGTMVSGVAHDMNNPLSNIYSSCQILHEEIEDADLEHKKEMLGQIESEVERAKMMVQSLLEFSRKAEFKRKNYLLKNILEETIRLLHGDLPSSVEIQSDIPEDAAVCVDKQRIQQVFINLIKNAVDAMNDGGVVAISAENVDSSNGVLVRVRDNGVGIEAEKLGNIFDSFFTTKEGGSGLGLYITREIIEEHQGWIEVESTHGDGTVFSLMLPAKEETECIKQEKF